MNVANNRLFSSKILSIAGIIVCTFFAIASRSLYASIQRHIDSSTLERYLSHESLRDFWILSAAIFSVVLLSSTVSDLSKYSKQSTPEVTIKKPEKSKKSVILITLLVIVNLASISVYLNRTIRFDEAFTYLNYCRGNPADIFRYTAPNNHVFNTILIYVTSKLFGMGEAIIRLPSFLFHGALIVATYHLSHLWTPRLASLSIAGVVGFSPTLMDFAVNGRGYSMLSTFVVISTYLILKSLYDDSAKYLLTAGIVLAASMFTVPSTLFVYTGLVIFVFF